MPRQDKRPQIMQAAEHMFASRRFHEITLDDVAQEARIGKGTIYRYFRDKDDLFFQTATSGFEELCVLLQQVPGDAPFREQLVSACRKISRFFERRRRLIHMIDGEDGRMLLAKGGIRQMWMQKRKGLVAAMGELMRRGINEGFIRDDLPADVLGSFLLGMLRTRARDLEGAPDHLRREEIVVDLFCQGAGKADGMPASRQTNGNSSLLGNTK